MSFQSNLKVAAPRIPWGARGDTHVHLFHPDILYVHYKRGDVGSLTRTEPNSSMAHIRVSVPLAVTSSVHGKLMEYLVKENSPYSIMDVFIIWALAEKERERERERGGGGGREGERERE